MKAVRAVDNTLRRQTWAYLINSAQGLVWMGKKLQKKG